MKAEPYIGFGGRCEEAINFYKEKLGAQVDMIMHMKDAPEPIPGSADKGNQVLHSAFRIGESTVYGTDCAPAIPENFQGFSLSLTVKDTAAAQKAFDALSAGGKVHQPLMKTFFSPSFGVVKDKFGISWMVYVPGQPV